MRLLSKSAEDSLYLRHDNPCFASFPHFIVIDCSPKKTSNVTQCNQHNWCSLGKGVIVYILLWYQIVLDVQLTIFASL